MPTAVLIGALLIIVYGFSVLRDIQLDNAAKIAGHTHAQQVESPQQKLQERLRAQQAKVTDDCKRHSGGDLIGCLADNSH